MKLLAKHEAAYMIENSNGRFSFRLCGHSVRQNGEKTEEIRTSNGDRVYVKREWVEVRKEELFDGEIAEYSETVGFVAKYTPSWSIAR